MGMIEGFFGFFLAGKFGKHFFVWLDLSGNLNRDFLCIQNNTCQIFLPKQNPGIENFKPKNNLQSSRHLKSVVPTPPPPPPPGNVVTHLKKIKAFCKKIATPGHGSAIAVNNILNNDKELVSRNNICGHVMRIRQIIDYQKNALTYIMMNIQCFRNKTQIGSILKICDCPFT